MKILLTLAFALSVGVTIAEKDSSYYPPGVVNPNTLNAMYWRDAENVMEDLDQFESLYVKYHGCVTAQYGPRYSRMDHPHHDDDDADADGSILGCGAVDGRDMYWYMGQTQCFRPQASYSLYGILKNSTGAQCGGQCSKSTYINSFFTRYGVKAFVTPLGVNTTYANSYCTVQAPSYDDDVRAYLDDAYNKDGHEKHDRKINYANYTSYGMGCSAGNFVMDTFVGGFCDGNDKIKTTDKLNSFNAELQAMQCMQIYDSSSGYNYSGYFYAFEDDDKDKDDDTIQNIQNSTENPVEMLMLSQACSLETYPKHCPDPYGMLGTYQKQLSRALSGTTTNTLMTVEKMMISMSCMLFLGTCVLALFAYRSKHNILMKSTMNKDFVRVRAPTNQPGGHLTLPALQSTTTNS